MLDSHKMFDLVGEIREEIAWLKGRRDATKARVDYKWTKKDAEDLADLNREVDLLERSMAAILQLHDNAVFYEIVARGTAKIEDADDAAPVS